MDSPIATSSSGSTLNLSNDGGHLDGDLVLETPIFVKPRENEASSKTEIDSNLRWRPGDEQSSRSKQVHDQDDYDMLDLDPKAVLRGSRGGGLHTEPTLDIPQRADLTTQYESMLGTDASRPSPDDVISSVRDKPERRPSFSIKLRGTGEKGRYILKANDPELREILRKWLQGEMRVKDAKKRTRFSDLVFTRQFSAFDRQNSEKSPFHGFYTLFWLATFLMLVRIAAGNWKVHGSIFGRNEILSMMFHRDVIVLGLTDGFMCASTVFCLLLQKAISAEYLSWNRHGWIIQNVGHDIRKNAFARETFRIGFFSILHFLLSILLILAKLARNMFEVLPGTFLDQETNH